MNDNTVLPDHSPTQVLILRNCLVQGHLAPAGSMLTVPKHIAFDVEGSGRGRIVPD